MNKIITKYQNGTQHITIFSDGTKWRDFDETQPQKISHPESMDVKITNYCDVGCEYCHECSTVKSKHGDIDALIATLRAANLPMGVELAIGGGAAQKHPDFDRLLIELHTMGFICNLTINQKHLREDRPILLKHINAGRLTGIGVSVSDASVQMADKACGIEYNGATVLENDLGELLSYPHIVYHLIVGVHPWQVVQRLPKNSKVLLLGYKDYGKGKQFHSTHEKSVDFLLKEWKENWKSIPAKIISMDNLAIEQLNVQNGVSEETWKERYMGNDFTHSMYIDAVKQKYAPTSRSSIRESFDKYTLLDYFQTFSGRVSV